jgi:molybdopterin molybdotransferase
VTARAPLGLAPPAEALAALLALVPGPVAPRRVPAAAAVGRVLAGALVATRPIPAAPVAARDGWAVASVHTAGAGPYAPSPLPGTPAWVESGEPLPAGADAVLTPFEVDSAGPFAAALAAAAPGDGVRAAGEEAATGLVLRAAGERLRPLHLPALVALGIEAVAVRVPRVALLPVGDELMAAGATPAGNALPTVLAGFLAEAGADADLRAPVGDDPAAIGGALREAAAGADLVLAMGGTGEGRRDRSASGLDAAGRLLLHGIGARPGTTAALGEAVGRPVILLPGRAEDALAAWWLLARPALRRLTGAADPSPRTVRLARKVASVVGMAELVPLRFLSADLAEPLAVGALPLSALTAADALLVVPPGAEGYEAGATIAATGL